MSDIIGNIGAPTPLEAKKKKSDDTTGLFVSLYLIVLAFFVVMNSISNQDQNKVDAATESVTRAFKNPFEPEADFVDVAANEEAVTPNDEFHDQILGVFASLVGFDGKFATKGGDVVRVQFNPNDLFMDNSSEFQPNQQPFLKQLSFFLAGGRSSERREINFVISSGMSLPQGPRYWQDLTILRAGAFVHKLTQMNVAENQMSIGVVKGPKEQVTLTFHNREVKTSVQGLADHETKKRPKDSLNEQSGQDQSGQDLLIQDVPDRTPRQPITDNNDQGTQ
ncbi:MAG: flagellar motor protein MotB [Emcibacter sp.]|nr:flagellar motor protein MotB [Emcibacter sp.]